MQKPSATTRPTDALSREEVLRRLHAHASTERAAISAWFFKTGPGEYGEGDRFIGVRVPHIRAVAKSAAGLRWKDLQTILRSPIHEERLLALLVLVAQFEKGDESTRAKIASRYLASTRWINNWDLVDLSAPNILGEWLTNQPRDILDALALSTSLWERRIAIVATHAFIRRGQFADTLRIAITLKSDPEDLLHKACGWMLREVGKRDISVLRGFLADHAATLPRTALRYAIERMTPEERKRWMTAKKPKR